MITKASVLPIEIVAEKGVETEIRCTNCGKKLQTVEKTGAFGSKSAALVIKTKCTRCYKFGYFIVK